MSPVYLSALLIMAMVEAITGFVLATGMLAWFAEVALLLTLTLLLVPSILLLRKSINLTLACHLNFRPPVEFVLMRSSISFWGFQGSGY